MSAIRVNGVTLYYEEHAFGEPIPCIHGTGSSSVVIRRSQGGEIAVDLALR
jgi:hypothetical protein